MNNPKVSVIMPTYNVGEYIQETIDSILNQSFKDFEFIIIDDASSDNTLEIIEKKKDDRIVLIKNEKNLGISKSRNKGIGLAKGEYIMTMDSDDYSFPDRLKTQYNFIKNNPDIGVVGGDVEMCDEKLKFLNKREYPTRDKEIRKKMFRQSPFAHGATLIRKDVFDKIGLYNENLINAIDYEIYFRIGKFFKFANIKESLIKLRTHKKSISRTKARTQEINSLYIRLKAVIELGYKMSFFDKIFFIAQVLSLYLVPTKMKFWIFNFLRKS